MEEHVIKDNRIKELEEQLSAARIDMQISAEEQEAYSEELQSANEEIIASNEELQRLNDELEISKEEIEAINEALTATNQELHVRNDLLNESYDYSEAIIATIHEPMVILDKDLRVKSANKSFYNNFRVKEQETEGTLLYDLGNKQWNIPGLSELLEDIIPKNTRFHNFEVTHTFPDIGEKIMLLNASRIVQQKHGLQLILLAIEDVTEVRMKTLELQRKEKELFDQNARERKAEKIRLEQAVEERTQELAQANKELIFQNEEKEKRAAELVIANKELAFQNEEKEKRAAELIIANKELIFQNKEKEERAAELIIANEELAFQNAEKEKRAAELIIANKELIFQNEEKEKRAIELIIANKELLAFTYVSSHDLQEPLRKIQTFTGRILDKEVHNLSNTGTDLFERIQSSAGRMRQLIEDLLVYSRTNITERKFEKTELSIIIEEVKNELRDTIEDRQATIDIMTSCAIYIIRFQFIQLIDNLIRNALKFSSPGRLPHIIINSNIVKSSALNNEKLSAGKSYCHISIADNGIGFEPQYASRIFEVFQKLHAKETYEGTGIGLAIVKKIVENHNGTITATGVLNEGATFDIYIPVDE